MDGWMDWSAALRRARPVASPRRAQKTNLTARAMEDPDLWTKNLFSILMHQLVMQNKWLSDCRWNLRVTEVEVESYGETTHYLHHRRSYPEMRTEK